MSAVFGPCDIRESKRWISMFRSQMYSSGGNTLEQENNKKENKIK